MDEDVIYHVSVTVPDDLTERMMDSIDSVMTPVDRGYRRAFSCFPVKSTWKSMEGSDPFNGRVGSITVADEVRIEFICLKKDVEKVLRTIRDVHPYEEPMISVSEEMSWKSFLH